MTGRRSHGRLSALNGVVHQGIDLAFEEADRWTLIDFKTDDEIETEGPYRRQLGLYARAIEAACAKEVVAILMRV